jgi:cell division protein FtsI (penicillin-binding protein 3)
VKPRQQQAAGAGNRPRSARGAIASFRWRSWLVMGVLGAAAVTLVGRAVFLQLYRHDFLAGQGNERFSRVATITAHRGNITDRNGEPLAVSTPVDSVWVNPQELQIDEIPRLARALGVDRQELGRRISSNMDREFLYVARQLPPAAAGKVKVLNIPGVYLKREYRRYYPAGEVAGHVVGFTDVDDAGQEGLELAFDHWLAGEDGAKRVIQDGQGHFVQDVDDIRDASPGHDLRLSIDQRIQYLAYRELKAQVRDQGARAGSMVVLDVRTGEVLAMVNQPAYNPNDRSGVAVADIRNRAVTDMFEPGSTMKPFFVAAALASGRFDDHSVIDTAPGYIKVGAKVFEDEHDLGPVDMATILAKSSNVGMIHIEQALPPKLIWTTLSGLGFGQVTASGFPGESAGLFSSYVHWRPIGIATMSHGNGVSVTPLQLAQAYATIGAMGLRRPVSFLPVTAPPAGRRVLDARVCRELIDMLETVVSAEGTGKKAAILGYRVAGKTGTAWKAEGGGYDANPGAADDHLYMSVFGGMAPATNPRLAAVVVIDSPSGVLHQGGDVAAPVFSAVIGRALRLLGVPPDEPVSVPADEAPGPLRGPPHPGTQAVAKG